MTNYSVVGTRLQLVSDKVRHKSVCVVTEQAGRLKFRIYKIEKLHYFGSKNKGTDQPASLRSRSVPLFLYMKKQQQQVF